MTDRLYPLPLRSLLEWMLEDWSRGALFGLHRALFFRPGQEDPFRMRRYGRTLETPLGVAAGPHTQLAQNMVAAWLCGARTIELKTVQTLDRIEVPRPCIDMEDEGYNCEWSQELALDQSFDEYLKAWILIHVLQRLLEHSQGEAGGGLIFNMSLGYDLAGIRHENMQRFMERMADCSEQLERGLDEIRPLLRETGLPGVPHRISDSVTLSTMHGCPPGEIEAIGRYLIEERALHTAVKLNPTLLGREPLRELLNARQGFGGISVPDSTFEHDLKYDEALSILNSLADSAKRAGVEFGVKLTNTLEVENNRHRFPAGQESMYLSGRALHPVAVRLAAKLSEDFAGELDISFCGGVDCFNVAEVTACGLAPVTVCSDLLKPGGYGRLGQYIEHLEGEFRSLGAESTEQFIRRYSPRPDASPREAARCNLRSYSERVCDQAAYHRVFSAFENIRTDRRLGAFDCVRAPCVSGCATEQDIPGYLRLTAAGRFDEALEVVLRSNPLPGITGMVCDQLCRLKCTRGNYDRPLLIRDIKRFLEERGSAMIHPEEPGDLRAAVIGAGPAGLSCAWFLALTGFAVEVFERRSEAGGMPSAVIPGFRLDRKALLRDIRRITDLGVRLHLDTPVDRRRFAELRRSCDAVFVGPGAQLNRRLGVPGEDLPGVLDPLVLLQDAGSAACEPLGRRVAVIGGGNTAIDAARSALRLCGPGGEVLLLYRRTRYEMPAEPEEVQAALEEGIQLRELVAPVEFLGRGGRLRALLCRKMKLGAPGADGRPRPLPLPGSEFELELDAAIAAVGQDVELDIFDGHPLRVDPATCETNIPGVYAGGDVVRGAASVIQAVGDGRRAAAAIVKTAGLAPARPEASETGLRPPEQLQLRGARRRFGPPPPAASNTGSPDFDLLHGTLGVEDARDEAERCLDCDRSCDVCVSVCPNLANRSYVARPVYYRLQRIVRDAGTARVEDSYDFEIAQSNQVLNLADFCNECGNCVTFCPTAGSPFLDKPRFHLDDASFRAADRAYRIMDGTLYYKEGGQLHSLAAEGDRLRYEYPGVLVILDRSDLRVLEFDVNDSAPEVIEFHRAAAMAVLLESLRGRSPFDVRRDPGTAELPGKGS